MHERVGISEYSRLLCSLFLRFIVLSFSSRHAGCCSRLRPLYRSTVYCPHLSDCHFRIFGRLSAVSVRVRHLRFSSPITLGFLRLLSALDCVFTSLHGWPIVEKPRMLFH